ncbi:MAG: shikimate dehydrogenase [Desulfobacteraceae bacterium 4572_130]|nr:MAG: shikimate dehydrogenase [Desulfobacteraceae bacterium 4572_130]
MNLINNSKTIDSNTSLFGLLGNPVSHSLGHLIHNQAFFEKNINALYLPFKITNIKKGIQAIKELGIKGVSITIPFKQSVIPYLDEIDDLALKIGAVNTIINKKGKLYGYNTDCNGAIKSLKKISTIKDKKICIIGAGGAARAIAFGIKKENGKILIVNRTREKGEILANQIKGELISILDIKTKSPDIIINTTSIGMTPDIYQTPLKKDFLSKKMVVMDIVYNPLHTRFLKNAAKKGCTIINGLSMFVNQGAAQFELFTGIKAPVDLMKKIVFTTVFKSRIMKTCKNV